MVNYSVKGFVIVPPVNSWDDAELVIPRMSYNTFGLTPREAWMKHLQGSYDALKVNAWIDRGYTLKDAELTIKICRSIYPLTLES